MEPVLPSPEADHVALFEILLAIGRPECRSPAHDEEPFLVRVVRVVRPKTIAGLQLVQAAADQLRVEPRADPRVLRAPALAVLDPIPLVAIEVEYITETA